MPRADVEVKNFINGRAKLTDCAEIIRKYSPRDGDVLCEFGVGCVDEVNEAVDVSLRCFQRGDWASKSVGARKKILHRFADLIDADAENLAHLECLDTGKPITDVLDIDLPMAGAAIRAAAENSGRLFGTVYAADPSAIALSLYKPAGVVGAVVGWNFPLVLAASKIGPALSMGNSLILKPSEVTPLATSRLAMLACEAGVPPGVFNVVQGDGRVGEALGRHMDINVLTFTGSSQTGKRLLVAAGQSNMKRLILECGGKAANIVFEDCQDVEAVAGAVIARAFWNQGQVCTASSRLLVHKARRDELVGHLTAKCEELSLGDPMAVATRQGPLISKPHLDRVLNYIHTANREGAELLFKGRGEVPFAGGYYLHPHIFGCIPQHTIAKEEVFGPVLSVMSFEDEAEAIRIANDTIYGLSAIAWTRDLGRAHRLANFLDVGWLTVNGTSHPGEGPDHGTLVLGGLKQSGWGVEGGIEGLQAYTSRTLVQQFV